MYRRTAELLWFDLVTSLLRLKGLVFLIPFALFWFLLLRYMHTDLAAFLEQPEAVALANTVFDAEQTRALFVDHPPILSVYFMIGLTTLPLFGMLCGMDQFAGDLGRGYFQLLVTRCRRIEIFLGRYLASLLMMTAALIPATAAATILALVHSGQPPAAIVVYGVQIGTVLFLYGAASLAFVAFISVITRSAIGALFLAVLAWIMLMAFAAALNAMVPETEVFHYLLPSGLKPSLYDVDGGGLTLAALCLPGYALVYAWLAWLIFRSSRF